MLLITRFGASLVAIVTLLPTVLATVAKSGSSTCKDSEFWYKESSCCLQKGGPPSPPPPPKGSDCPPSTHYWGTNQGCCVPRSPPPQNPPPPQCKKGWEWVPGLRKCIPMPTSPTPPPSHPSPKPGNQGGNNGGHDHGNGGYNNGGHGNGGGYNNGGYGNGGYDNGGHGGHGHRRSLKARSVALCPSGLDACPIAGSDVPDYECVDTATDLEYCGGCPSLGRGQDCTAIPNAWNVGCDNGRCVVYTCFGGFKQSPDGKSCVSH